MLMSAEVTVKNIEGFDEQFDDIYREIDADLNAIAAFVKEEAVSTTAFKNKTGNLRKSIKKYKSRFEDGGYIVYAKGHHAHLVEYGHVMFLNGYPTGKRVPAHPFLRPALEKGISKAVAEFGGG
jgi:hypothetical protein